MYQGTAEGCGDAGKDGREEEGGGSRGGDGFGGEGERQDDDHPAAHGAIARCNQIEEDAPSVTTFTTSVDLSAPNVNAQNDLLEIASACMQTLEGTASQKGRWEALVHGAMVPWLDRHIQVEQDLGDRQQMLRQSFRDRLSKVVRLQGCLDTEVVSLAFPDTQQRKIPLASTFKELFNKDHAEWAEAMPADFGLCAQKAKTLILERLRRVLLMVPRIAGVQQFGSQKKNPQKKVDEEGEAEKEKEKNAGSAIFSGQGDEECQLTYKTWTCPACGEDNKMRRTSCNNCSGVRPQGVSDSLLTLRFAAQYDQEPATVQSGHDQGLSHSGVSASPSMQHGGSKKSRRRGTLAGIEEEQQRPAESQHRDMPKWLDRKSNPGLKDRVISVTGEFKKPPKHPKTASESLYAASGGRQGRWDGS